jgi:hypothetical protein
MRPGTIKVPAQEKTSHNRNPEEMLIKRFGRYFVIKSCGGIEPDNCNDSDRDSSGYLSIGGKSIGLYFIQHKRAVIALQNSQEVGA